MQSTKQILRCLVWVVLTWVGFVFTSNLLLSLLSSPLDPTKHNDMMIDRPISQLCSDVPTAKRRQFCFQDLTAVSDIRVRNQFARLLTSSSSGSSNSDDNKTKHANYAEQFHDAAIVCALAIDLPQCVHDVLASGGNTTIATSFDKKPLPFRNQLGTVIMEEIHHEFTEQDAEHACSALKGNENSVARIFCEKHFVQLDDEEIAKHYIHMSLDSTTNTRSKGNGNGPEEAQMLCGSCPFRYYPQCLQDVQLLPDFHVGAHFVQLYKLPFDSQVPQADAERLCNHVVRKHSCIRLIQNNPPNIAAMHYLSFFKSSLLSKQQAMSICGGTTGSSTAIYDHGQCIKNVQTMNSVAAAQLYAELLRKQQQQQQQQQKKLLLQQEQQEPQ